MSRTSRRAFRSLLENPGCIRSARGRSARPASRKGPAVFAALELLEPRQLLSALDVTLDGITVKQVQYTDGDGSAVSVKLAGGGSADLTMEGDNLGQSTTGGVLTVSGQGVELSSMVCNTTTVSSALSMAASGGDDGGASIGQVTINGALKSFTGKTVDLIGDLTATGGIGKLTLRSAGGADQLTIDLGQGTVATSVTIATLWDVDLVSGAAIAGLKITDWGGATPDSLEAPSIGKVTVKGGSLGANLNATAGNIGNISISGGDLAGSLQAAGSIGNISVKGVKYYDNEMAQGGIAGGNVLSADITAGSDTVAGNVGNITAKSGSVGFSGAPVVITAWGNVGKIASSGANYTSGVEELYDDETGDVIGSRKIKAYQTGGIYLNTDITGSLGGLKVAGGDIDGGIYAGSVGAMSASSVKDPVGDGTYLGGNFTASVTAVSTIASLSVKVGTIDGTLAAGQATGPVKLTVKTINAKLHRNVEPGFDGEPATVWYDVTDGSVIGGPLRLLIELGVDPLNPSASLGAITARGADIEVTGHVPWDPETHPYTVSSTGVKYTFTYEEDENGKMRKVTETAGGPESVSVSLEQIFAGP